MHTHRVVYNVVVATGFGLDIYRIQLFI